MKKKYLKPEAKVHEVTVEHCVLAGSPDPQLTNFEEEDW